MTTTLVEAAHIPNKLYKKVFSLANDGMLLVNGNYEVLVANEVACKLFNIDTKKDLRVKFFTLFDEDHKEDIEGFQQSLLEDHVAKVRLTIDSHISDFTRVELSGVADIEKGVHLLNVRDITEREAEYRRRERFVAVAGHELKTPLAVIKAYAQLLRRRLEGKVPDRKMGYLKKIENKADLLNRLIDDLVEEIKAGSGTLVYEDTTFRLDSLITNIINELNQVTKSHKVSITHLEEITVHADKTRIMQIVNNLLTNAIKYSPNAKLVVVELIEHNGIALLKVSDFGRGIPKDEQRSVFKPFYRSKSQGKKTYQGLGLGLYIARTIVRHYGGQLWFESKYGKGSEFYLELPVKND